MHKRITATKVVYEALGKRYTVYAPAGLDYKKEIAAIGPTAVIISEKKTRVNEKRIQKQGLADLILWNRTCKMEIKRLSTWKEK